MQVKMSMRRVRQDVSCVVGKSNVTSVSCTARSKLIPAPWMVRRGRMMDDLNMAWKGDREGKTKQQQLGEKVCRIQCLRGGVSDFGGRIQTKRDLYGHVSSAILEGGTVSSNRGTFQKLRLSRMPFPFVRRNGTVPTTSSSCGLDSISVVDYDNREGNVKHEEKDFISHKFWKRGMRTCKGYFVNGRAALPLLFSAAPVAVVPPSALDTLAGNYVFAVGFCGWFLAQFLKIFTKWYKTGRFSLMAFVDSGGMPSSHSSLCSAVTTAVAIHHGLGSTLFAICTCFSVIVMYDAMGVRRHAGLQAEVLNAVVEDLLEGHPVSERKLKEVLGHTPRQVLAGAVLGIATGLLFPRPF